MKYIIISLALLLCTISMSAQEQINASMEFQTDPSKDYSIVIPSSYTEGQPTAAFLALHPWNTNRWNGQTWCEELADFAEANNVILICPDGGSDGQIDDPIDTAFTTFILDSAFIWYDIDPDRLYATGFSWGARTTYTYGLNHVERFAGLMPIGAAIEANVVNGISANADNLPVYVIHGSQDSPSVSFYPLLDAMEENGACLESRLLNGVGHTIDFANQVEILSAGYAYLQENACTTTSTTEQKLDSKSILPYNAFTQSEVVDLDLPTDANWSIYTTTGIHIKDGTSNQMVIDFSIGHYIIKVGKSSWIFKVI